MIIVEKSSNSDSLYPLFKRGENMQLTWDEIQANRFPDQGLFRGELCGAVDGVVSTISKRRGKR